MKRHTLICTLLALCTGSALADTQHLLSVPQSAVALTNNIAELTTSQTALTLLLPEGKRLVFSTQVEHPAPGMTGVIGHSSGSDRLSMFFAGDRISGDVYASGGHYRLAAANGSYWWTPVRDLPNELPAAYRQNEKLTDVVHAIRPTALPRSTTAKVASPGDDGNYQIDVLLLYTSLYEVRYGGRDGTIAEAQRLIFLANTYFENTSMPIRYRVVGVEKYTGITEDYGFYRSRNVIARDPAVQSYRSRIGADVVALLRTMDGTADLCGLASLFDEGDHSNPPQALDSDFSAFAVTGMGPSQAGQRCDDYVLAHELGHVLSGGHNFAAAPGFGYYWQPYSHGWQCGIAGAGVQYHSIMSYGNLTGLGCVVGACVGIETAGDFFSTPNLTLDGQPCGSEIGAEPTLGDNARSLTEAAPYVAAYRGQ